MLEDSPSLVLYRLLKKITSQRKLGLSYDQRYHTWDIYSDQSTDTINRHLVHLRQESGDSFVRVYGDIGRDIARQINAEMPALNFSAESDDAYDEWNYTRENYE